MDQAELLQELERLVGDLQGQADDQPGPTAHELADAWGLAPATVRLLLVRLGRAGLVEREKFRQRSPFGDRVGWTWGYRLTEKGRARIDLDARPPLGKPGKP